MNYPDLLGHYRIEAHLGDGRVTRTFRALDTVRRRPVALKLLPPELATPALLQEARLAAELVHPRLAWLWEADQLDGQDYLAERFINGQSLRRLMAATGPVAWEQVLEIIAQSAQALDFARRKGWVHGDVCPENILFSPEQGAVLSDFGLSRLLLKRRPPWPALETTAAGSPLLRPEYAAPELWQGQPPSPASDQYALACTAIELLTGRHLFQAAYPAALAEQHLTGIKLPSDGWGAVPKEALESLQQALSPKPEERFASAEEFATRLERHFQAAAQREAAAWQAAAAERRRLAEEAERQRLLEEARREVFAQAQRYPASEESSLPLASAAAEPLAVEASAPDKIHEQISPSMSHTGSPTTSTLSDSRATASRRLIGTGRQLPAWDRRKWISLVILSVITLSLVIGAIWLIRGNSALPSQSPVVPGPINTTLAPMATATLSATAQPTATHTGTSTNTLTPLPSSTATPTPTTTATVTLTATPAPSATPTFTPTAIRPERETQPPRPFPFPTSRP